MMIKDLNAINWREQDSIADDTPIKIDMSNEAKTKVEITMIGSEYSLDASTDENKKMNAPGLEKSIKLQFKSQTTRDKPNCREKRMGNDQGVELVIKAENQVERGYVIEFDESCLVGPTTQEEINMVTQLPKKTVFRVYYVPRTLKTVNFLEDRTGLLLRMIQRGLREKRLAEWVEVLTEAEQSYNGTDKIGELATVVVVLAAKDPISRMQQKKSMERLFKIYQKAIDRVAQVFRSNHEGQLYD
ncbi:hypothetical protein BY996DRAFT_6443574 [Phakopsora pachyrhizi]|nr:hypothetical protein BY996DRAFT_6443574 [Phakopsora pachyrhizi]